MDQQLKGLRAIRPKAVNEMLAMESHRATAFEEVAASVDIGSPRLRRQPDSYGAAHGWVDDVPARSRHRV